MELALYNAILTAMSHEGTKFTYVNQLASTDEDPSKHEAWFTRACCPPNVMRVLGCIGGYIWTNRVAQHGGAQIDVHLFINSVLTFEAEDGEKVELEQKSAYRWSGDITFKLRTSSKRVVLNVRIPAWTEDWSVSAFPLLSIKNLLLGTWQTHPHRLSLDLANSSLPRYHQRPQKLQLTTGTSTFRPIG